VEFGSTPGAAGVF